MKVHYSKKTSEWNTPQDLFDELSARYGPFDVDLAATKENAKCVKWFEDAFQHEWQGRCYMNPPYGREIGKWLKKAYESAQKKQAIVVCLLPARTDTNWFHDYALKGEITFLRGRVKFEGAKWSAPFPSMVVVFR